MKFTIHDLRFTHTLAFALLLWTLDPGLWTCSAQLPTNNLPPASVDVRVGTNGALIAPANFFAANSNAVKATLPSSVVTTNATPQQIIYQSPIFNTGLTLNPNDSGVGNSFLQVYDQQRIYFGTPSATNKAYMYVNATHGGIGDGSEFTLTFNQAAFTSIVSGPGGWLQLGNIATSGPFAIIHERYNGSGGPGNPSGMDNFQYSYTNGSSAEVAAMIDTYAMPAGDTAGSVVLRTFAPFAPNLNNARPDLNSVPPSFDRIFSGTNAVGIKGYGASIADRTSTTVGGSSYNVNLGMAWQDVYLSGALTINFTNLGVLTNTYAGTLNEVVSDVVFYPGTATPAGAGQNSSLGG